MTNKENNHTELVVTKASSVEASSSLSLEVDIVKSENRTTTTATSSPSTSTTIPETTDDKNNRNNKNETKSVGSNRGSSSILSCERNLLVKQIAKCVVRQKLQKLRHLVIPNVVSTQYLDTLFPPLLDLFEPQTVTYNGGVAKIKQWKISCYLEVMDGGVPCTNPNLKLLDVFRPLLDTCNDLFMEWYRQQHACNNNSDAGSFWERRARQKAAVAAAPATDSDQTKENTVPTGRNNIGKIEPLKPDNGPSSYSSSSSSSKPYQSCRRLMAFITRYTPAPGEQALLKHVDGAGKVDGSCVVALPIDRWSAPYDENTFEGHGGGLTFWDGKERVVVPCESNDTNKNQSQQQQEGDGNCNSCSATSDQQSQEDRKTDQPSTKLSRSAMTKTTTTITRPREIHYDTRSGDIAFIDRAVWHQADPITKGTRWALVIFYKVE
jgi:hypothetical protein